VFRVSQVDHLDVLRIGASMGLLVGDGIEQRPLLTVRA
jgi:hypothetical protein